MATRNRLLLLLMVSHLAVVTDAMPMTESAASRGIAAESANAVVPGLDGSAKHLPEHHDTPNRNQSLVTGRESNGCSWPTANNIDVSPLFWSFVNVSCRPGFQFQSGPPHWTIVQCVTTTGRWSPEPKSCIPVSCPPLRSFTDARLNTSQVSFGTRVNVSCAAEKHLMGSSSNWIVTECQADGTWSATPSNCLSAAPGTPTFAYSLYGRNAVRAMDLFNGELFVIRDNEKYVSVYDSFSLVPKRQIPIPAVQGLFGLAVGSADNLLYVSESNYFRIHKVDLSTNIVTGWNVALTPYGLSVASNGNVLVCTYESSQIQEYTSNGTLVRTITDSHYTWQAVERITDGTLLALRLYSAHGITQRTRDGARLIRSFGSTAGSGPSQMNNPRAIAVDSEGSILVVDQNNNRIQLVDSSLSTARTLPLPQSITLNLPQALCYDEPRGRLYVGETGGQLRVLVFDNVINIY